MDLANIYNVLKKQYDLHEKKYIIFYRRFVIFSSLIFPILIVLMAYIWYVHLYYMAIYFIILIIIFPFLTGIIYRVTIKKADAYKLDRKFYSFIFIYSVKTAIESYKISNKKSELDLACRYLNKYMVHNHYASADDNEFTLYEIITSKSNHLYDWIEFTDDTNKIIAGWKSFNKKIFNRISNAIELDKVLYCLNILVTYEHINIADGKVNIKISKEILYNLAESLENLTEVSPPSIQRNKPNFLETIRSLKNLYNENFIFRIFFLFLLVTVLTTITLYGAITIFKINLDSTILIGSITIIITVLITAAQPKNNKTE